MAKQRTPVSPVSVGPARRPCRRSIVSNLITTVLFARPSLRLVLRLLLLLLLLLFSSPNLSGRRLDVYHTSTHGVALVRI